MLPPIHSANSATHRPIETTDAKFQDDVVEEDGLVLVDFYAPWCGPCRRQAPELNTLAEAAGDKVKVVKLNVDENPDTAGDHNIRSLPTMAFFREGGEIERVTGFHSADQLSEMVDRLTTAMGVPGPAGVAIAS